MNTLNQVNTKVVSQEEWTTYTTQLDDKIGVIKLDLNAIEKYPDALHSYTLTVNENDLKLNYSLSSDYIIESIEKSFRTFLERNLLSHLFVGSIQTDNYLDLVFVSKTEITNYAIYENSLNYYVDYCPLVLYKDDEWGLYINILYPNAHDYSRMNNIEVCKELRLAGDNIARNRIIYFELVFSSLVELDSFLDLINNDYKVFDKKINQDNHYVLTISIRTKPQLNTINALTDDLNDLLYDIDAYLDGWYTNITQ